MKDRTLVCPYDEALLAGLSGRRVVIAIDELAELERAAEAAERHRLELRCLAVHTDLPLVAVPFGERWLDWPIALFVPRLGRFRELLELLPLLRRANVRLFLPTDQVDSYRDLRILASLGLACGVDLRAEVDWEALTDLMTYALLGLVPHGTISPFEEMAAAFCRKSRADFGRVYFDDAAAYLHLDRQGRVALSAGLCARGEFVADHPDRCEDLGANPVYLEHQEAWRQAFLEPEGCAWCPGWRACYGRWAPVRNGSDGCRDFAVELLGVLETKQSAPKRRRTVWQP